jgi:ABC-2 type transport system permease protein
MRAANILHLGVKELWGLARDPLMLVLIVFAFTVQVYSGATALPETLNQAPIAIVDEDQSPLSARIIGAFYPPYFLPPVLITRAEMDARMDAGLDTLALNIPPQLSARRAGRAVAGDSAQRRRDPRQSGLHRQRVRPVDRQR